MKRLVRVLLVSLVVLPLAACTLPWVERYDADITEQINKYHKDVVKFVKAAEQTKPAAYTSTTSKTFYSTAAADLSNMVVRAQALAPGQKCVPAGWLTQSIDDLFARLKQRALESRIRDQRARSAVESLDRDAVAAVLEQDSCTVIILKALKANHDLLEANHRDEGDLKHPVSTLSLQAVEDSVRVALKNEAAKKR